jgi:hypothetical protein
MSDIVIRIATSEFKAELKTAMLDMHAKVVNDILNGVDDHRYWIGYAKGIADMIRLFETTEQKMASD